MLILSNGDIMLCVVLDWDAKIALPLSPINKDALSLLSVELGIVEVYSFTTHLY